MSNALKARLMAGVSLFQTPRPVARDFYAIRPASHFAEFLGCICGSIPRVAFIGIEDNRIRTSSGCPLHGRHPKEVQAYV
jgi:hypothetical protein